jgi:hypothetical protein
MNFIRNVIIKNQEKIHFLFLGGAGIAGLNTLLRPDYNLVVYLYLFYVWTMMTNSKVFLYYEKNLMRENDLFHFRRIN